MSSVLVSVRQLLRNQQSPVVLGLQRSNREPGVKEDGTFVAENVFGRARFQVTLPDGWMLKAVTHQGRDIGDAPIELGSVGQWQIKGLPSGEYLAIALDYVEDGAWNDPEYLEALKRDAEAVTIADGASQTVSLKLVIPKQ